MLDRTEELGFLLRRFRLLRVHGINQYGVCTCADPACIHTGKHPAERAGYQPKVYDDLQYFEGYNVGVATGQGLVVVDVDPRNGGHKTLQQWEADHGHFPPTWIVETGGGGRHFYFHTDRPVPSARFQGIEIQSDGHYVVGPTSHHESGRVYEWADEGHPELVPMAPLPEWLHAMIGNRHQQAVSVVAEIPPCEEPEFLDCVEVLNRIDPDLGYHEWLVTGMAMKETGHRRRAFKAWDDWCRKGSKYREGEPARKWNSFKHRTKDAMGRGAVGVEALRRLADQQRPIANVVDLAAWVASSDAKEEPPAPAAESGLFQAYGLVKDLATYFSQNAYRNHPAFALEAAFATMVGVCQGGYALNNTSPILYSVLVGPAACGKNDYLYMPQSLLMEVDQNLVMGNVPASDRGLRSVLTESANRLLIQDEIISWMVKAFNPKSHEYAIQDAYCTLWGGVPELAGTSAKKKEDSMPKVTRPRFSILGTGTVHQWRELVHVKGVSQGGLLSRMMFVESDARMAGNRRRGPSMAPPPDLVVRLTNIHLAKPEATVFCNPANPHSKDLIQMEMDAGAARLKEEWEDQIDLQWDHTDKEARHDSRFEGGIRMRGIDRAIRYAMLLAIGDGRRTIEVKDIQFAREYVDHHSTGNLETLAQFGQSSEQERNLERLSALIASRPKGAHKSWLWQRTRSIEPRLRDQLLAALVEEGEVTLTQGDRGGTLYVHRKSLMMSKTS